MGKLLTALLLLASQAFALDISQSPTVCNVSVNGNLGVVSGRTSIVSAPVVDSYLRRGITLAERNAQLLWVEQQIEDSLTRVPLADGYRDFFGDQSGVDLGASANVIWEAGSFSWSNLVTYTYGLNNGQGLHLTMNDSTSSLVVADVSGNELSGISYTNTDTISFPGAVGGALFFDGTNGVEVTNAILADATSFTLSLWIKPSYLGVGEYANIFGAVKRVEGRTDDYNSYGWFLEYEVSSGYIRYYDSVGGGRYLGSVGAVPKSEWTHVSIVAGSAGTFLYTNNVLCSSGGSYTRIMSDGYAPATVRVGAPWAWQNLEGGFLGSIDDVRLIPRAISESERAAIYNAGAGSEAPLADVSFDTQYGNTRLIATNSEATLLDFDPSEGRLGVWIEETTTNLVPNADAKGYLSRDAGTNWVQVDFTASTRYSTNSEYVWYSDVTNLPGVGSNLLWKFESCNTNKGGRIKGAFPQVR